MVRTRKITMWQRYIPKVILLISVKTLYILPFDGIFVPLKSRNIRMLKVTVPVARKDMPKGHTLIFIAILMRMTNSKKIHLLHLTNIRLISGMTTGNTLPGHSPYNHRNRQLDRSYLPTCSAPIYLG